MTYTVLDCTLRDGGYYTNWDFPDSLVSLYLGVLAGLDVDTVELGYLSPALEGYLGRYYYLPPATLAHARSILRPDQKLAVMLNAKDCDPKTIAPIVRKARDSVQVVRLAVAPNQLKEGIALARAVADEGFEIGFNVMYLSKWAADPSGLRPLAEHASRFQTVSLVDSYGGCSPEQVATAIRLTKQLLPQQKVGFHGHDNIQLAFANALAAVQAGADGVDATILGMGRGAGNLRTELILAQKARSEGKAIGLARLGSLVEAFEVLRRKFEWGSNLPYIVSGLADLPQKDVMDWLGKQRYSTAAIVGALQNQGEGLVDHVAYPATADAVQRPAKRVLVVGGGASVREHAAGLAELLESRCDAVVHSSLRNVSVLQDVGKPQVWCLPGHNAILAPTPSAQARVTAFVVPPPPRFVGTALDGFGATPLWQSEPVRAGEAKALGPVSDVGPLGLALGAARDLGATEVLLAGFDGYEQASRAEQELTAEVQGLMDVFRQQAPAVRLAAVTPTLYAVEGQSLYALLGAPR